MQNIETVVCRCLTEHEILADSSCLNCQEELLLLHTLQGHKAKIENAIKQLAIELTTITALIHLRTVKPAKAITVTINKPKEISYTRKKKAKLEAMELLGLVMADRRENNNS